MGIGRGGDQVQVPMGTKLCTYQKKKKKTFLETTRKRYSLLEIDE